MQQSKIYLLKKRARFIYKQALKEKKNLNPAESQTHDHGLSKQPGLTSHLSQRQSRLRLPKWIKNQEKKCTAFYFFLKVLLNMPQHFIFWL